MRLILLSPRPTAAAQELFACACNEAARLSLAVGVEHLVLATALRGTTLARFDVDPEDLRERILADERDALASLGISLDSVRGEVEERFGEEAWTQGCGLPVTPEAKRVLELATHRRRHVSADELLATLLAASPKARRLLAEVGVPVDALALRLRR